jgi:hypothetical protein
MSQPQLFPGRSQVQPAAVGGIQLTRHIHLQKQALMCGETGAQIEIGISQDISCPASSQDKWTQPGRDIPGAASGPVTRFSFFH